MHTAYKPRFRRNPNRGIKNRARKITTIAVWSALLLMIVSIFLLISVRVVGSKGETEVVAKCIFLVITSLCFGSGPLFYFWFQERDYRAWLRSYEDLSQMRSNLSW